MKKIFFDLLSLFHLFEQEQNNRIMHRRGTFKPVQMTCNQCKVYGTEEYNYSITMIFSPKLRLDKMGFIIDHQAIDDIIQNLGLKGSCEQMQDAICEHLCGEFKKMKIPMWACKISIGAVLADGSQLQGWMHKTWAQKPKYLELLAIAQG